MNDDSINLDDLSHLPFEEAVSELENIIAKLERGDVTLDESISIYERGEALKSHCEFLLCSAEKRIEQIKLNRDNKIQSVKPFDEKN
ncbi:exodeoxyribonuclease VII small subunit [Candidatus Liberibacter asiaticus]|uniref:Exodeoxyribonuclease 7 small subunit n=2 Tax=Liberibacter asiaticus TaxID=34021 RepID=C6XEY8_LIBAP|nr:exodeoxyribonuclease VII small subunit [Candidatus Liberibacter asiaticus]ACT56940.1 exodeoxyribonuclease VII small subunit [Candidatus Liberibacter asiaticus str. psy62]AGH16704.1 exodeoxyribonuclease VII small subunit [Candidatus Liberibacter asiaticus str. gxpsy]ALK07082.1 exodeoxyribonuclease VII small subunit [Candidatus Liberibacter asiaticus]ASK52554.1 exodeoxyribonuclease VII small subunit [Candidatus Liberibacter asiaticus]AWL13879.1 exodeoxyribonuclease VII small subunit [Candidat